MRPRLIAKGCRLLLFHLALVCLVSCGARKEAPPTVPTEAPNERDPCAMIPREKLESLLGLRVASTSPQRSGDGKLNSYTCNHTLSPQGLLSITVTEADERSGGNAIDVRDDWNRFFRAGRYAMKSTDDDDQQRDRGIEDPRDRAREDVAPIKINGIGNEAYWAGSDTSGTFYVLTDDRSLRIQANGVAHAREITREVATLLLAR